MASVAAVGSLFVLARGGAHDGWSLALGLLGFTFGLAPMLRTLPDKADGTLDFLATLPVEPATLASSHVLGCAVHAFAAAVPWTAAVTLALPGTFGTPLNPAGLLWAFVLLGLAATTISSLGAAVMVRFPLEALSWASTALLLGVLSALAVLDRVWPGGDRVLFSMLFVPRSPAALVASLGLLEALVLGVAHRLMVAGYARLGSSVGQSPG